MCVWSHILCKYWWFIYSMCLILYGYSVCRWFLLFIPSRGPGGVTGLYIQTQTPGSPSSAGLRPTGNQVGRKPRGRPPPVSWPSLQSVQLNTSNNLKLLEMSYSLIIHIIRKHWIPDNPSILTQFYFMFLDTPRLLDMKTICTAEASVLSSNTWTKCEVVVGGWRFAAEY